MSNYTGANRPARSLDRVFEYAQLRRLPLLNRLVPWFCWASGLSGCAVIAAFIAYRSVQQYPLDAFEEYEIHKAVRWSQGAALYGTAQSELLPEAYPPLYFCLLRVFQTGLGDTFLASRAMSLVATAGVIACGFCWLRGTGSNGIGRLAFLTAFLSFDGLVARCFDVGKPDMLFGSLLALTLVTARHRNAAEAIACSVGLYLACLTKQNGVLFLVPIALWHFVEGRRIWAIGWGAGIASAIAISYLALEWYTEGNFLRWVFYWTAGHGVDFAGGLSQFARTVSLHAPALWIFGFGAMAFRPRNICTWCLFVAIVVAIMGLSKAGGRDNHLLPLAFAGALIVGEWSAELWSHNRVRWVLVAALWLVMIPGLPGRRDFRWIGKRAAETTAWVDAVRNLDGRVAVSHHWLLARRADADCFFSDLILQFRGLVIPDAIAQSIERQEYDYLILCESPERVRTPGWRDLIERNYCETGSLPFQNISQVLPDRVYRSRRLTE